MHITEFEKELNKTLAVDGYRLYRDGAVGELGKQNGYYLATVNGDSKHTAGFHLSAENEIISADCDCEREGEYCTHMAAVYFVLREKLKEEAVHGSVQDLAALLEGQPQETLAILLKSYAERYAPIEAHLRFHFTEGKEEQRQAKRLIESTILPVKRRGFVEYGQSKQAVEGAVQVLHQLQGRVTEGDPQHDLSLCILVLEEMLDLLTYCNDDDGNVAGTIGAALSLVEEIGARIAAAGFGEDEAFSLILRHAKGKAYDRRSEWRFALLRTCVSLYTQPNQQLELEAELRTYLHSPSMMPHLKDEAELVYFELLIRGKREEAARSFALAHLENDILRQKAVDYAMAEGELDEALQLCLDGEKHNPHHQKVWRELRYVIYERQGNEDALRLLSEELVLSGDELYYQKLKALYSAAEWPAVLERLYEVLEGGDYIAPIYVHILIVERQTAKIAAYCRDHIYAITYLYRYLQPDYEKDVEAIFAAYIREEAANAADLNQYGKVCGLIRKYKKACGLEAARTIIAELKERYPRRTAFMRELEAVFASYS